MLPQRAVQHDLAHLTLLFKVFQALLLQKSKGQMHCHHYCCILTSRPAALQAMISIFSTKAHTEIMLLLPKWLLRSQAGLPTNRLHFLLTCRLRSLLCCMPATRGHGPGLPQSGYRPRPALPHGRCTTHPPAAGCITSTRCTTRLKHFEQTQQPTSQPMRL